MNDRDRLIEIIYCAGRDYDDYVDAQHEIGMSAYEDFDSWLADDLLANGVIIPPCKVGQTVYYISFGKVYKGKCHAITQHKHGLQIHLYDYDGDNAKYPAKKVFLTKEEAESELRKRSGYNA
ncbi:MAG: hypothetical protein II305_06130 [Clostridia bacterium]|nr:hypothetical protein [Clostridia bacterium]MBQ5716181.1 hypothetical protein [Clostridia bacterium]